MNKKLLFAAALTLATSFGFSQELYDDFDNAGSIVYKFADNQPGLNEAFANPATGGINASALCGGYERLATQTAGLVFGPSNGKMADVTSYVNGTKSISMDMFVDAGAALDFDIRITLQNGGVVSTSPYGEGKHSSYIATFPGSTSAGQWVNLTFNYDATCFNDPGISVNDVDEIALEFYYNVTNDTQVCGQTTTGFKYEFLWDNFMGPELNLTDPCAGVVITDYILDDFECQRNFSYEYANGGFASVPNPLKSGSNLSDYAGKFTKNSAISDDGAFGGSLPLSIGSFTKAEYNKISLKLYDRDGSLQNDTLLIGVQDASSSSNQEALRFLKATPSSVSEWQEYVFDLSSLSPSAEITDIVFLWNPHTMTDDAVYIDDIVLSLDNSVSIIENESNNNLKLYPNPAFDFLNIESKKLMEVVDIYDVSGRVVKSYSLNKNKTKLNIEDLDKGNYYVSVIYIDGSSKTLNLTK